VLRAGHAWLVGAAVLITGAAAVIVYCAPPTSRVPGTLPAAAAPVHFRTLPPGAQPPSGARCAHWVRASPSQENRPANEIFNHTMGHHVGPGFFPAGDSPHAKRLALRVGGDFTGTTKEILRWAACKWGINQNIVFAQAAVESWWQQGQLGDWGTNPLRCPEGHDIGGGGQGGCLPAKLRHPPEQVPGRTGGLARYPQVDSDERRCRIRHLAVLLRRI
jgi:hypothetical protein